MKHSRVSRAVPSQKLLSKVQVSEEEFQLNNPNISVEESLKFMRKLTVVAISSIAYLRGVFPSDAFQNKRLAEQQVFVLQGSDCIPGTRTLISWIKGAFELVHSHHLKKMIFVIQKEVATLETYTFSFSYNHDEINYDLLGEVDGREVVMEQSQGLPEDIGKSVRQLIRCILTHATTLHPLPDDCEISVKLVVDDDTPAELLPEFFQPSGANDEFNFPAEVESLKLGKVNSKYTTFAVSSKSVMNREDYTYSGMIQEENIAPQEDVEDLVFSSQLEPYRMTSLTSNVSQLDRNHLTGYKAPENDSHSTNLSEKLSVVSLKEKTFSCICECSDLFDATIKCVSCSTLQHKACYKLLECHQLESHVCVKCHNPDQGKICSEPDLLKLNDANRKESALYRQALIYCCTNTQVSCKRIMTHLKVPRRMAEKIFQQLDKDGFLLPATNKGHVRNVEPGLKENISRFFSSPPTDSMLMDIEDSPASVLREVNGNVKRQHSEEKENLSFENTYPQPKRRKILKTTRNVGKSYYEIEA